MGTKFELTKLKIEKNDKYDSIAEIHLNVVWKGVPGQKYLLIPECNPIKYKYTLLSENQCTVNSFLLIVAAK